MSGKYLKKTLLFIIVLILVMGLTNCQKIMEIFGVAETKLLRIVFLEPDAKTMPLGTQATYKITGVFSDSHGDEEEKDIEDVVWSSSDESVCTVSLNDPGDEWRVYAEDKGTATITVTKDSLSGSIVVTVIDPVVGDFMVSSGASYDTKFEVGSTHQFTASANGNGADIPESFDITPYVDWEVPWESLDPVAATIDETGLVTFQETGSVAIRATLPESIQSDSPGNITSTSNIEVVRSVTVNLDLTGTPNDAPLILSALYDEDGRLAAMFPEGAGFIGGNLSLTMFSPSGDLFYPYYSTSTASVGVGTYSLYVVADMNDDTFIDTGDLGSIVSVSASYGNPVVVDETVSTSLIDQTVSISGAGSIVDNAPITVFWLVEGDDALTWNNAPYLIPYLASGDDKQYPYPEGLREFSTGYFDEEGAVTTLASTLIPGTYDLAVLIDGDNSGGISANTNDYFFYVAGKTVTGADLDISLEFDLQDIIMP
jgi:hypothetical protein